MRPGMSSAVGIFASCDGARKARQELIASGVPAERISLSEPLTADGIAGEAPGESYENQDLREDAREKALADYGEAVRSGACTLSVAANADDELQRLERLLEREGAHIVTRGP